MRIELKFMLKIAAKNIVFFKALGLCYWARVRQLNNELSE